MRPRWCLPGSERQFSFEPWGRLLWNYTEPQRSATSLGTDPRQPGQIAPTGERVASNHNEWEPSIAEYLITCVNTQRPHRHITSAEVQELSGDSYDEARTLLVGTICTKLAEGDRFNTYSPSTDRMTDVHSDVCAIDGCEVQTIRSDDDAIADNNLDNLPCRR